MKREDFWVVMSISWLGILRGLGTGVRTFPRVTSHRYKRHGPDRAARENHAQLAAGCVHTRLPACPSAQEADKQLCSEKKEEEGKGCLKVAGVSDLSGSLSAPP